MTGVRGLGVDVEALEQLGGCAAFTRRHRTRPATPVSNPRPMAMFSATVRSRNTPGFWWTKCRFAALACAGDHRVASWTAPAISSSPPGSDV